ncbi:sigma-70 family RNA polymerase sigma factor [Psychrobacillus sp. L3]|uniref:sigma-70 family RNA polymerase sigma factor n=1 Tax=Psychrobacillus sp. L3 TaxID=3236891 RepID=UPI0036F1E43B
MKDRTEDLFFEELIRTYGEELLRLAFTYVKNRTVAEDVVQEVFVKAFEKRKDFRGEATYRTYLYRMTINQCHDYLRSWAYKNTRVSMMLHTMFSSSNTTETSVIQKNDNIMIGNAVLQLPTKYREVIVLYYYKGFQIDEIAELIDCSVNTVKTRLRRGREQLKNHFTLEGEHFHERFSN